jgi:hypothetical protein
LFIGVSCSHCKVGCGFNAAAALSKRYQSEAISKVFVRKFEVSGADIAATLRGRHIRNATSLSLPRSHCRARFIAGLKSNKLSQWQPPDANNQAGKQEPAY